MKNDRLKSKIESHHFVKYLNFALSFFILIFKF